MRRLPYRIKNRPVVINVVETEDDLPEFAEFAKRNPVLAYDTETTGLKIFSPSFRVRLAQFGNGRESYVIPVEKGAIYGFYVRRTLEVSEALICHNATFDLLVSDRHLSVPLEVSYHKTTDTRLLAHLIDPRLRAEGGSGHSLEELTDKYIDSEVAAVVKGSMTALAKELKTTKANVFTTIDLDHPDYNLYAGMDPILTFLLHEKLSKRVPQSSARLVGFEHRVAFICALMERTGFLLDVEYSERLRDQFTADQEMWENIALSLGVEKVNSGDDVAEALIFEGVNLTEKTPTGRWKVDKTVLEPLALSGSRLAEAVVRAKQARKWRTTWVDKFLTMRDSDDRCHASIHSLQARTGRMSCSGIPAQTFPSGEASVRHCFIADEGEVIASIDYQAQELRVLAALSEDRFMKSAFARGEDLHGLTAQAAFGPNFTPKHRKIGKVVNFRRVYGGGAKGMIGIDRETAEKVVRAFDEAYPGVAKFSKQLQKDAKRDGYITTVTGRRLPVDRSRAYSALNYEVQSSARDITCRGLIECHKAGLTPYLRLPIHDEVVASLPEKEAKDMARQIGELMRVPDFRGVDIATDAEVGLRSWGSLYE